MATRLRPPTLMLRSIATTTPTGPAPPGPVPGRRTGRGSYKRQVQDEPERSSARRSPGPRRAVASSICAAIWAPYSGRSTSRNTPIGVLRDVERPEYGAQMAAQIEDATARRGPGDLRALLRSGSSWTVE